MLKKSLVFAVAGVMAVLSYAASAEKAPGFKLPTISSKVNLDSYRGRVVYVDFWASWCGPCRKSFPWMTDLQKRYRDDLKVIAINLDQERSDAIEFIKETRPRFTIAFDPAGRIAESYDVSGMPSSYLIDQSGNLVSSHIGFRISEKEKIENKIRSLLSNRQARTQ